MAALDSLRSFLSFFYSPRSSLWSPLSFPLVTNVYPFGHQGLSLLSLRVFPLVIKVPHLHLHSFEVKCDERTNELTYRTESRTMSVISIDEINIFFCFWFIIVLYDLSICFSILYKYPSCLTQNYFRFLVLLPVSNSNPS